MNGLDKLREKMADFLQKAGLDAVTAWKNENRTRRKKPVVVVSLRGLHGGPAALSDYLGERMNPDTGLWEELYGKRAKLTLGLDIYAPECSGEAGCADTFAILSQILAAGNPPGLAVTDFSREETVFDSAQRLFRCPVQMTCNAFLYAKLTQDGTFSDFYVRGIHE